MKRAVITGLGIVSSIGNNQQEVLSSLREGRSGITFLKSLKIRECVATYGVTSNWTPPV